MHGRLGRTGVAVALIVLFLLVPIQTLACDCAVPADAGEGLEQAAAVFVGEVEGIRKEVINGYDHNAVWIKVDRIWKGIDVSEVIIYTSWSLCQFDFDEGESYLLYPYAVDDKLYVESCGRSAPLAMATADLEQGEKPTQIVNLAFSQTKWHWFAGSGITVLVVAVAAFFFIRNMKPRRSG